MLCKKPEWLSLNVLRIHVCWVCKCLFMLDLSENHLPHLGHWKGFSPVCTRKCLFKSLGLVHTFPHIQHTCLPLVFASCCQVAAATEASSSVAISCELSEIVHALLLLWYPLSSLQHQMFSYIVLKAQITHRHIYCMTSFVFYNKPFSCWINSSPKSKMSMLKIDTIICINYQVLQFSWCWFPDNILIIHHCKLCAGAFETLGKLLN